jgi:hypothetical protein
MFDIVCDLVDLWAEVTQSSPDTMSKGRNVGVIIRRRTLHAHSPAS